MNDNMTRSVRVLHVDDESSITDLTATFLERKDDQFTIETAPNAEKGLEIVSDRPPDCVVSDYEMPGLDGIEFLQAVRQEFPDLPFILYTGKGSEAVASDAIAADATDYLQKGTGSEQYELLANRIRNAVRANREAKRADRHEQLMRLTEFAGDTGGFELDRETNTVRLTAGARRLIERPDQRELSLQEGLELVHPDDREQIQETLNNVFETGEKLSGTLRLQSDGGDVRLLEVTITPVIENGEVQRLRGAGLDITDRQARREELEEYETIIEALTDAVYVLDENGRFTYVNDELAELAGYDRETILGCTPSLIKDEDAVKQAEHHLGRLLSHQGSDTATFEVTIQPREGEPIVCEDQMGVLPYDGEEFDGSVGTLRDLTDRKEQEHEVQDLKERLKFAVDGADLGVWDWDMQTDDVEFNDNWATMLGYDPDEIGSHLNEWEQRVHPDDLALVEDALDEHIAGDTEYYETEHRMRTADGGWKWVRDVGKIFERDEEGNPTRAVGIHIDIDERKTSRRVLEEERDMFAEGPTVVFKWRAAEGWPVEYVSDNVEDVLGYKPDVLETGEKPYRELIHPEDRERVAREVERNSDPVTDRFSHEPYRVLTADDDVRWVLDHSKNIRGDGDITHMLGYLVDITEQKQRENELERQNERLDTFASTLSHDIRNPLNVATAGTELATQECDTEHLDDVTWALSRMEDLMDDLLLLARQGETVGDKETISLKTVVEECWRNVETGEAALNIDDEAKLKADRSRFTEALENLFRNAIQHGGESVTATVGILEHKSGFYVADDGQGIPASDWEDVFDSGFTKSEDGTGFGLTIVNQIYEAHGWDITVTESTAGGARFEITRIDSLDC